MVQDKDRIVFLDYVRVIACLLVIMVHASETFYSGQGTMLLVKDQSYRLWMTLYDGFSRVSVPLFIMVSSYLLAPLAEDASWSAFFRKRFKRIVPPMLFFFAIYAIWPALTAGQPWGKALKALAYIPFNFPGNAAHLWFMFPLLGNYLITPFISPWLRTATKRQEQLFLLLWAVSTCLPYLNRYVGEFWGQCWWNSYDMLYNFAGYPGYLVLAHYIREHIDWSPARRVAVGLPCFLAGTAATMLSFYLNVHPGEMQEGMYIEMGWCFCTINCVVCSFGAFLLFSAITRPGPGYGLVRDIAKNSYGMYLMHMLWLWPWASFLTPHLHIALAIPAIVLCTYICSYLTTKLLSLIPGSRWIIG